jgi:ribosomal protein S18 acetylase RimI-like enzyme
MITVRIATVRDAGLFTRLRRAIERETDKRYLVVGSGERRETTLHTLVRFLINGTRLRVFFAFYGNEPVGYLIFVRPKFAKLRGNGHVSLVAVKAAYQGKGIGTRLMSAAEEYARSVGCRRLELEVFEQNAEAVRLYERLGYEREGLKREAVTLKNGFDNIVIMAKFIARPV